MRPATTICAPRSDCGFKSTGFMSVVGLTRHAFAWSAWARPISPPSSVTAALFDMFCGLNGRTARPRRTSARPSPATSSDLPTSEPVPCSISAGVRRCPSKPGKRAPERGGAGAGDAVAQDDVLHRGLAPVVVLVPRGARRHDRALDGDAAVEALRLRHGVDVGAGIGGGRGLAAGAQRDHGETGGGADLELVLHDRIERLVAHDDEHEARHLAADL